MYWSPVWVELMWCASIYASIFSLENQTSSMLKQSNPVHHCSTAQTKIMGPLLSKLHNLQYYVHILPKWVSSKTNFPLLNTLMLQMKFSFLHNVSPPKLTVSVFLTPAPVLCKSLKTAPSKYSLYIGLQGGFQCSVRLIRWPVTAWVVELPELQTAWNSYQNSIASPAMTLGCFVDCSETHLFLAFQIIQDSIRNCSTVLSQPSSNTGQNILTKSRNSCSNYLFSAAPNSLCLFTIP